LKKFTKVVTPGELFQNFANLKKIKKLWENISSNLLSLFFSRFFYFSGKKKEKKKRKESTLDIQLGAKPQLAHKS
jgi:hypothetical protein